MMNLKRRQSGYMIEVPLILLAVAVLVSIAVPRLPVVLGKVLVVVGALVWIGGLYYMIVVPGWQPGNPPPSRWRRLWKLLVFIGIAGFLIVGAGAYVVRG